MVRSRASLLFAVVLLAAPLLAGCLGFGGEDAPDEEVQKQRAEFTADAGGVEGVVTDAAVQPIQGANVTLVETNETVTTAADGSYALSNVAPGTYTLAVNAPGFISSQQPVTVRANQASVVDFIITQLALEEAYTQQIEWNAFFECGIGVGANLTAADMGYPSVTWAACATLNFQGNTTNDDFSHNIDLEAPLHTLVWEAQWDPSGNAAGDNLWLAADVQGHAGLGAGNWTVFRDTSVSSPFRAQVDKPTFQEISTYFQERCEGTGEEEQDDSFCGYNFWDNGWPLTIRTFTAVDCLPTPVSACAPLQLQVQHVFSAFYNAPAPAGFSVYQGGA
ncbi:MAG: carboxypeptidase-like regulatory domain-containing protein [Candidatus Thermoplasmatota archaeon]|nr:carboxypeptidase-like regulatory domain-containing protein [Candidatus Thermoplasmatota archaeon]